MSAEQNKQAVREMSAAFSAGDIDKAFAFYADDIQWTITGTTSYSGTYHGKQDLRERLMGKLGEDLADHHRQHHCGKGLRGVPVARSGEDQGWRGLQQHLLHGVPVRRRQGR